MHPHFPTVAAAAAAAAESAVARFKHLGGRPSPSSIPGVKSIKKVEENQID